MWGVSLLGGTGGKVMSVTDRWENGERKEGGTTGRVEEYYKLILKCCSSLFQSCSRWDWTSSVEEEDEQQVLMDEKRSVKDWISPSALLSYSIKLTSDAAAPHSSSSVHTVRNNNNTLNMTPWVHIHIHSISIYIYIYTVYTYIYMLQTSSLLGEITLCIIVLVLRWLRLSVNSCDASFPKCNNLFLISGWGERSDGPILFTLAIDVYNSHKDCSTG